MDSFNKCSQVLKTGQNKGEKCGCKVFKDNLCTRHYKLANNNKANQECETNIVD